MDLQFNENSLHAKFFKRAVNRNLPDNLCQYFWLLLAAILLQPLIWPTTFTTLHKDFNRLAYPVGIRLWTQFIPRIGTCFIMYFLFLFGHLLGSSIFQLICRFGGWACYNYEKFPVLALRLDYWQTYTFFPLTIIVASFAVGLTYVTVNGILDWFSYIKNGAGTSQSSGVLGSYLKAKKEKYCPHITWKNDNE